MRKKKVILSCILLSILASGAFAAVESKKNSLKSAVSDTWAVIGAPTLQATEMPTSTLSCINASAERVNIGGSPRFSMNFDTAASSEDISRTFNIGAGGSGAIPGVLVGANASFASKIKNNDYTYNLTYLSTSSVAKAEFIPSYGNSNLSADGLSVLASGKDAFFQTCGDSFVSSMDAGALLAVNVAIKFKSKQDMLSFMESASLTLNAESAANVSLNNLIDYTESHLATNAMISISALQNGGTPEKLAEVLTGSGVTTCTSGDSKSCATLISNIVDYANGLGAQIRDKDNNLITKNLYYYNPVLSSYASLGIDVPKPSLLSSAAVNAQLKVADELNDLQAKIDFLNNYNTSTLQTQTLSDVKSYVAAQTLVLNNRVNFIKSKVVDCFNAQAETCPAIVEQIENTFKNSTSAYNFDESKYKKLKNNSWSYVLNGDLTYLIPVSFANTFVTETSNSKTNNKVVQGYTSEENGVSYISEFDIPYKTTLGGEGTYKCLPATGDSKFANTRRFSCSSKKLFSKKIDLQFTKSEDLL